MLTNGGDISGNVDLGDGADTLVVFDGTSFGGTVDGGAGQDTIRFGGGTIDGAVTADISRFTNFEKLESRGGYAVLATSLTFPQIDVVAGSLFAKAGTTITGNVVIGSGGNFGSAGTVVGNVTVNTGGTFSPGASPAIMRINGNLAIGNGTTTVFEFVPVGQSDQIIVNGGSVTIGTNTTVNLTGALAPGSSRDLIVVNGGGTLSGTFTTVNRDVGVVGVLRYNSTVLQLLGTFVAPTGITPQANAGLVYVNGLLTGGTASENLITAVPSLMSGAAANVAAFNLITGEAYASAIQFGVQRGLTLAKSGRTGFAATRQSEAAPFSFVQGIGDWRRLKDNAAIGTSSASANSYGALGGLGFGSETGSIGAFIGYIDGRQMIAGLGARTDADGVIAGISGHVAAGGFSFTGTIAHDWSQASTRRAVPGAGTVSSGKYRLRSWVIDAAAAYEMPLSKHWIIAPEAGITHVFTRRGATAETGSGPFALTVDAGKTNATFIDGGIKLKGNLSGDVPFHPWVQLAVRHQLSGNVSDASAGFVGNTARFTVIGASRKGTVGAAGVGVDYEVSPGVSLFGAYHGEFGNGRSHNLNVGLRFGW